MTKTRPRFWFSPDQRWRAVALSPLAALYGWLAQRRRARPPRYRPFIPAVSIGNLTVGGQGKTPVALALGDALSRRGYRPVFLLRGYGGRLKGPHQVDPAADDWRLVGDEALMIAQRTGCDTWIGRDRALAARMIDEEARKNSNRVLILDDAHQNTALALDRRVVVIDGADGFGNGRLLPAGPLREPREAGLRRADAVVLFGADSRSVLAAMPETLPVVRATLRAIGPPGLAPGQPVIGFAGIGRPAKFRQSLAALGLDIRGFYSFPDHHGFSAGDLNRLAAAATRCGARLVTTEKDSIRLPERFRSRTTTIAAAVAWETDSALAALLGSTLFTRDKSHDAAATL